MQQQKMSGHCTDALPRWPLRLRMRSLHPISPRLGLGPLRQISSSSTSPPTRVSPQQHMSPSLHASSTGFARPPQRGDKIIVAMSGGVDSSVSLRLLASSHAELDRLRAEGYHHPSLGGEHDLSAVFMRNWSRLQSEQDHHSFEDDCEWEKDWEDVQRVCRQLGVPCRLMDLSHEYWLQVFEPAIEEWQAGRTPNPDVSCNREIKFGALMEKALTAPQEYLATGHYAGLEYTADGRTRLIRSSDPSKDQTYYLSSVPERQLAKAVFPLAGLKKTQVRELAKRWDLPTASRAESMGICFVGERVGRFGNFVSQYTSPAESASVRGDILTPDGRIVGQHKGLWHYTIGQKAKIAGLEEKHFVARKDLERNTILVVPGSNHPALHCSHLTTTNDFHWIWKDHPPAEVDSAEGLRAKCQIRHRMQAVDVIVRRSSPGASSLVVEFVGSGEKGVAPGQIAALWDETDRWCLGSGVIESTTTAQSA